MTHIDDAVITQVRGCSLLPRLALPDGHFEIESYEPMDDDHFEGWVHYHTSRDGLRRSVLTAVIPSSRHMVECYLPRGRNRPGGYVTFNASV